MVWADATRKPVMAWADTAGNLAIASWMPPASQRQRGQTPPESRRWRGQTLLASWRWPGRCRQQAAQRIHSFLSLFISPDGQKSQKDFPKGLDPIQEELLEVGRRFGSVIHHNRQVFGPYYSAILKKALLPDAEPDSDASGQHKPPIPLPKNYSGTAPSFSASCALLPQPPRNARTFSPSSGLQSREVQDTETLRALLQLRKMLIKPKPSLLEHFGHSSTVTHNAPAGRTALQHFGQLQCDLC
ncbi:hypothetical protein QYF61_004001 [Mycteria americana]|uniref:Uncharacterized protein n=1 Tax=Mycteria americana TaxID=33587 RepID=A0AAN7N5W1_MYCAM|nr:hypothetical protein QYF61_004001 [Mycteria americana]